jgi:hypothetical protein
MTFKPDIQAVIQIRKFASPSYVDMWRWCAENVSSYNKVLVDIGNYSMYQVFGHTYLIIEALGIYVYYKYAIL